MCLGTHILPRYLDRFPDTYLVGRYIGIEDKKVFAPLRKARYHQLDEGE